MAGMAGMAGEFMSSCQSKFFRDRIAAQIAGAKEEANPDPESDDQMEKFLAQNTAEQLEDFIYHNSKGNRDEYMSLTADMLLAMRQCKGRPGQGRENLRVETVNGEDSEVPNGATPNGDHREEESTTS